MCSSHDGLSDSHVFHVAMTASTIEAAIINSDALTLAPFTDLEHARRTIAQRRKELKGLNARIDDDEAVAVLSQDEDAPALQAAKPSPKRRREH